MGDVGEPSLGFFGIKLKTDVNIEELVDDFVKSLKITPKNEGASVAVREMYLYFCKWCVKKDFKKVGTRTDFRTALSEHVRLAYPKGSKMKAWLDVELPIIL